MSWSAQIQKDAVLQARNVLNQASTTLVENMPSMRTLSGAALAALGSAQAVLGMQYTSPLARQAVQGDSAFCGSSGPYSCQNTTAQSNLCCFNAPGGALLQTQFWDTGYSLNSWTIHGLWVCTAIVILSDRHILTTSIAGQL
jgi:ribonuclease T2